MKTNLKKITALIMAFLVMSVTVFGISKSNVHAAGIYLSLSFSASEVSIGDEVYVTVSASSDEYFSCDINVGYDSGVLEFVGNSFGSGTTINISGTSGSGTLTFRAIASGSAYVYTSSDGYNLDGESVDISDQGAYIYVGSDETTEETTEETEETTEETTEEKSEEETTEEDKDKSKDCSLISIRLGDGTLHPEFDPETTSYSVELKEGTKNLDITALVNDEKSTYYVDGNENLSEGENTISIVVTAENGAYRTYTIYATVGKADDTKVDFKVDGKKYELVDKENISIEVPKDFKETDVIYKKKKISGYASPNKLVKIICLKNDKDEQAWFIVGNNDSISKYVEHKGSNLRLIFTEKPENVQVPKGFSAKKIDIDKNSSDVYVSDKDNSFYLVYAINLDDQEGWYLYDSLEGTYVRYADISENEVKATPDEPKTIIVEKTVPAQEKGFFTKKTLKKLIWVMAGMFIALCILCIVLFFINNNLSKKLKKAERSLKGGKNSDKGKGSNKESKENKKDSKKENKKEKNAQQNGEEIVSKAVIPAEGTEVSEETNEAEAYDNYADESEYADNNVEYNDGQAYDNNPEYSEEGYTEGDYSEEGYSEDGYAEGQEYSDEGYSDEEGYSEDNYEAESDDAAVYNYDQNYQDEYAGEDGAYSDSEYSEDGDGEYYSKEEYADSAVSEAEYETYDDAVLDEADYQEEVSEQDGYTGNASFERNIPNAGDTGYFENPFNITRKAEKPSVSYSFKQYDGGVTGNIEVSEVAAASEVTNSSGIVNMDSTPLYANVQKKDIGGITGCIFTTTEIGGVNASGVMDDAPTFETKGIVLEEAIDNNSNVNVPPAQEISSREEAMRKRPYGIDSAFDVVDEKDYNPSKADQNTVEKVEIIHKPNVEEKNTLNAAAAAFANIKKSVEESEDEEVSNDIPDNDEDIVFPTMHSDE